MLQKEITDFNHFIQFIEQFLTKLNAITLYRGQNNSYPLIPAIARQNPKIDTIELEKNMIEEFLRRGNTLLSKQSFDSWDSLIYAQHFGLKTRLLDWTSNPLIALWFACYDYNNINNDSFLYAFARPDYYLIDKKECISPFEIDKTYIIKPNLNNPRIIAQSGWFTVHTFSKEKECFEDIKEDEKLTKRIVEIKIPAKIKIGILKTLNVLGVNNQTVFPDIIGVCKQLNWDFIDNH